MVVDVPITSQGNPRPSTIRWPAAAAAAAAATAASVHGNVVHVKAVWATTKLAAIPRADHVAIAGGCRSAAINDDVTTVFKKHGEWTSAASQGDR